ncbi:hypothetical protein KAS42_03325 [bacterium]|nr:hypothetical protein [bacterium]
MKKIVDPNKIKIGDIILVAGGTRATINIQKKLGYGESSKWTHVAGSIGGYDLVEGWIPQSVVSNLQEKYVDRGIEIKVMRRKFGSNYDRIKVALWWAAMNNIPYDYLQLLRFPIIAGYLGRAFLFLRNLFNSKKRLICSELVTNGFYKQGYNLFNKRSEDILPADFDDAKLFNEVSDIWLNTRR